jgi:hypothetical protein
VGSNTSDQPAGSAHCSQRYERNQQRREKRKRIEAGEGLLSLAKVKVQSDETHTQDILFLYSVCGR